MRTTKAGSPCLHPGCPALRPCPAHPLQAWGGRPPANQRGYDWRWQGIRERVLMAYPICVACWSTPSTEVDHIIPVSRGGTNEVGNLQGLCHSCHAAKTARDRRRSK